VKRTAARTPISNGEDVINSLDVIARIEYLSDHDGEDECSDLYEHEELEALRALAYEASRRTFEWDSGEILIRESYFVPYPQELPENYAEVDFDGVSYFIR